jgi:hypothetical protein
VVEGEGAADGWFVPGAVGCGGLSAEGCWALSPEARRIIEKTARAQKSHSGFKAFTSQGFRIED